MRPFDFALISLGVWRISNMLSREDGPLFVFERLRHLAGIRRRSNNPSEMYVEDDSRFWGTLIICPWCLSVWVATAFALSYWRSRRIAIGLAFVPGASAVTCLIDAALGARDN